MSDVKPVAWIEADALFELNDKRIYSVMTQLSCGDRTKAKMPVYSKESIGALQAEIEALRKDGERFAWVLPIINGECDKFADARTAALARQFLLGENGRDAIDAAIAKEKQQECLK